jgi:hypothetical protein
MLPPVAACRSAEIEKRKASVRADRNVLTTEKLDFDESTFASKKAWQ